MRTTICGDVACTPIYCEPGLRDAHERGLEWRARSATSAATTSPRAPRGQPEGPQRPAGGVRGEGGRTGIGARIRTSEQDFACAAPHLLPLPDAAFPMGITLTPRVDRYGMITVKMCRFSVPVRFIDRKVTVTLTGEERLFRLFTVPDRWSPWCPGPRCHHGRPGRGGMKAPVAEPEQARARSRGGSRSTASQRSSAERPDTAQPRSPVPRRRVLPPGLVVWGGATDADEAGAKGDLRTAETVRLGSG
jgi:Mu transposase-like protein